ncbi:D-alanyl-D-alanine carboxypeptidase/D-alanyl-D-alanine-endopeptidase [Sulfitobacter sp. D35]|uniref:D-alanyl-D-alanine carboxypeptidase/D-alanyl-D-alanine endopeptidase n=1 Tax=Sulfitobacter sp. D35 TaxID=3083252 RepID=UPI00296F5A1B|nr:D-alanyl-D-alanine carboxypeptidase/D-alanyl-D-alanine-endopeptidase [Sulfitobacter sp. D35]MDW4498446.1 D-alanyl-D-alanine carboxypeptidase/D-alanyl-D-alanine-endopeptidase [Sulfitobacter sp. D35]
MTDELIARRNRGMTRRGLLGGLLATVASPVLSEAPTVSLRPHLRGVAAARPRFAEAETLVSQARLSGAVAFAVADAKTGEVLEGQSSATAMPPASTAKAITALYALDTLGGDFRFETRVAATGGVEDGVVKGDLVLAGGGDPELDTNGLAELASELKAAGVREVKGDFLVYDGALPRLTQIDADQLEYVGYNPGISGIALNFNRVHFEWRRAGSGYAVSMDARSNKYRPDVGVASMAVVNRSLPVYTYADGGARDDWTVAKGQLGNGGARWLPVKKPGLYAGDVFATLARSHGIKLKPAQTVDTLPGGVTLAARNSRALSEILRGMLRYSTNLTAEMVGLWATRTRVGPVPTLAASAHQMNLWSVEAMGCDGMDLKDHSGLSDQSRVHPGDMVHVLVRAHEANLLRPILKDVTMRDSQGRPVKTHPVKAAAKTGTLNFVSGLAGYVTALDGRELAFAIFTADEDARSRIPRADQEGPPGARPWSARSRRLQVKLVERWGTVYGS